MTNDHPSAKVSLLSHAARSVLTAVPEVRAEMALYDDAVQIHARQRRACSTAADFETMVAAVEKTQQLFTDTCRATVGPYCLSNAAPKREGARYIPRIVHQTWPDVPGENTTLGRLMAFNQERLRDYEFRLFSDEAAASFMSTMPEPVRCCCSNSGRSHPEWCWLVRRCRCHKVLVRTPNLAGLPRLPDAEPGVRGDEGRPVEVLRALRLRGCLL